MPEIERIADPADEDERPSREHEPVQGRLRAAADEQHRGRDRRQRPPAGEVAAARPEERKRQERDTARRGELGEARRRLPRHVELGVGEQRARQELPETGRQEVERLRRVDAEDDDAHRERCREEPEQQRDGRTAAPERRYQEPRIEHVELLLHRERPEMRERPRRCCGREVARLAPEDEVREVHRRGRRVAPEMLVPTGRREHDEERGEEPQDPACVERQRRERAVGEPAPDEARDQVARDDEEDVDAGEAGTERSRERVIDDDRDDRDRAQAVDIGAVWQAAVGVRHQRTLAPPTDVVSF